MNISKKNQKKKIVLLPGNGSGPELTEQCTKILDAVADRFGYNFEYCHGELCAKAHPKAAAGLSELTLKACACSDAILAGPAESEDTTASVVFDRLKEQLELFAAVYPIQLPRRFAHLSPLRRSVAKQTDFTVLSLFGGERSVKSFRKNAWLPAGPVTVIAGAKDKLTQKQAALIYEGKKAIHYKTQQQVTALMLTQPQKIGLLIAHADEAVPILHQASVLLGNYDYPTVFKGSGQAVIQIGQDSRQEWATQDQAPPYSAAKAVQLLLEELGMTEGAEAVFNALQLLQDKGIGTAVMNPDITYSCSQIGDLLAHLVEDAEEIMVQEERISQRLSTII